MTKTSTIVFAPETKLQLKELLKYVENNRPAINARKTAEYKTAVNKVKTMLQEYYLINPPKMRVKVCPWKLTGATSQCADIANTYSIPYWDVVYEAGPYIN